MNLTLYVWRQKDRNSPGRMERYEARDVNPDMSFLEMLDVVNEGLIEKGEEPIAFDSDCREGICGMCSLMINGEAHGPDDAITVCQLHMRRFKDGDTIYIEPWRARAFPVQRDLVVDRSAFDRIIAAGGFVSINCGSAPEANSILVPKEQADRAFDAATCISCGACVAACPNGSAMLFVAAKLAHLHSLPQGQGEKLRRTVSMVNAMDAAGFGNCSNHLECEAVCPKKISGEYIAEMNRTYARAMWTHRDEKGSLGDG
jgi:succinate dehydrogenase / fumarate reductase iron-sulfur subunit